MKTLRSVLGIVLGCLVWAAAGVGVSIWLFGPDPQRGGDPWLAAMLVFAATQVLAGYLAATISGRRRLLHSGIVAVLFALATSVTVFRRFEVEPVWYRATFLCAGAAAIVFGGYLATFIRLRK